EEELLAMNVQGLVPEGVPSFLPDSPEGKIGTLEGINRGVWSKLRGEKKGKRRLYCGVPVK
ncbi:MAG: hypothetical protein ACLFO3_06380, partial [Candidatus Acetothermia bacterium]